MTPAPPLTDLIAVVETDATSSEPLTQLATAAANAADLTDSADALVDHFVDRCRAAGRTWAEISVALGVSKQAAHKRFSAAPNLGLMARFTDRARHVITGAVEAARDLGHSYVGTEHLLLGLFPPGGVAATLLAESGLTPENVMEQVLARAPRGDAAIASPGYTPKAAEIFSGALSEALSMGHNYIGTEHLVLALFADGEGLAAQILANAGATHASYKEKIVTILSGFTKA